MENGSLDFETSMKKLQGILNFAVVNSLRSLFPAPLPLPETPPPWEQMSLCIIEAVGHIM